MHIRLAHCSGQECLVGNFSSRSIYSKPRHGSKGPGISGTPGIDRPYRGMTPTPCELQRLFSGALDTPQNSGDVLNTPVSMSYHLLTIAEQYLAPIFGRRKLRNFSATLQTRLKSLHLPACSWGSAVPTDKDSSPKVRYAVHTEQLAQGVIFCRKWTVCHSTEIDDAPTKCRILSAMFVLL